MSSQRTGQANDAAIRWAQRAARRVDGRSDGRSNRRSELTDAASRRAQRASDVARRHAQRPTRRNNGAASDVARRRAKRSTRRNNQPANRASDAAKQPTGGHWRRRHNSDGGANEQGEQRTANVQGAGRTNLPGRRWAGGPEKRCARCEAEEEIMMVRGGTHVRRGSNALCFGMAEDIFINLRNKSHIFFPDI